MTDTLSRWRDPTSKAFSCDKDRPPGRSADNMALFTAEAYAVGLISPMEFLNIVLGFEKEPGLLRRYPGDDDLCSWDDHAGVAAVNDFMAIRVFRYFEKHGWELPSGEWIGRIPAFRVIVKAAATKSLNLWEKFLACAVYVSDSFVHREETSGRIIIWLGRNRFNGFWSVRLAKKQWLKAMAKKYPGGPKEMLEVYFPPEDGVRHPVVEAAGKDWV